MILHRTFHGLLRSRSTRLGGQRLLATTLQGRVASRSHPLLLDVLQSNMKVQRDFGAVCLTAALLRALNNNSRLQ